MREYSVLQREKRWTTEKLMVEGIVRIHHLPVDAQDGLADAPSNKSKKVPL